LETPGLGPVIAATIVTPDLETSLHGWTHYLHHRVAGRGRVGEKRARLWGASGLVDAPFVWLANEVGESWLRLIEVKDAIVVEPFKHRGWMSLEVNVQDVDTLRSTLDGAPFEILGEPANLELTDDIRAMQLLGPAGEVLYLTEIRAEVPPFELPRARCPVDRLFIPVLLADNLDQATRCYERFPGTAALKFETKITVVNRARGLDVETRHPVSTIQLKGRNLIEIDQLDGLRDRPVGPAGLPAGIAVIAFAAHSWPAGLPCIEGTRLVRGGGTERFELITEHRNPTEEIS